jgi:hypothetical protein
MKKLKSYFSDSVILKYRYSRDTESLIVGILTLIMMISILTILYEIIHDTSIIFYFVLIISISIATSFYQTFYMKKYYFIGSILGNKSDIDKQTDVSQLKDIDLVGLAEILIKNKSMDEHHVLYRELVERGLCGERQYSDVHLPKILNPEDIHYSHFQLIKYFETIIINQGGGFQSPKLIKIEHLKEIMISPNCFDGLVIKCNIMFIFKDTHMERPIRCRLSEKSLENLKNELESYKIVWKDKCLH